MDNTQITFTGTFTGGETTHYKIKIRKEKEDGNVEITHTSYTEEFLNKLISDRMSELTILNAIEQIIIENK